MDSDTGTKLGTYNNITYSELELAKESDSSLSRSRPQVTTFLLRPTLGGGHAGVLSQLPLIKRLNLNIRCAMSFFKRSV